MNEFTALQIGGGENITLPVESSSYENCIGYAMAQLIDLFDDKQVHVAREFPQCDPGGWYVSATDVGVSVPCGHLLRGTVTFTRRLLSDE